MHRIRLLSRLVPVAAALALAGCDTPRDAPRARASKAAPPKVAAAVATRKRTPQTPARRKRRRRGRTTLGISRSEVMTLFSGEGFDFSFEESTPVDGLPRWIGKSPDGLANLE